MNSRARRLGLAASTSSSQANRFGSLALAFVFGAALSAAITFVAMRASPIEASVIASALDSPTDVPGELREIRASLAEIRRELAPRDASPSERAPAPSPPIAPELGRIEKALAAHDAALEALRAGSGVSKTSERGLSLAERKQRSSEPNWNALNAWLDIARSDRNAANALV